ncbi:MAG: hypothetical protein FWD78_02970 [Treponema sp.]|nr:hypothetical protein [Treponema sp.]
MSLSKGQTNNRNGRPRKNNSLTEYLAKFGARKIEDEQSPFNGKTNRDALAEVLWQLALKSKDLVAIKYIFDRIDGKPIETLRAEIDRGDVSVIKTVQKELFDTMELEEINEGTVETPAAASASAVE